MTAAKHTASPWKLKTLAGMGGPQAITKTLPGGAETYICLFLRTSGLTAEEQLANAKLIEKAPDLLRVMDDVNNALYRVDGDPEGVWRINQSAVEGLTELLNELRDEAETMKPEGHASAT